MNHRPVLLPALLVGAMLGTSVGTTAETPPPAATASERLLEEARDRMRAGAFGESLEILGRVIEMDSGNLPAQRNYAISLRRLGRLEEARSHLLAMADRFPDSQEVLVDLGYLERSRGRLDESARWFHRAAAMPDGWYNQIRLAVTYTDLGDIEGMRQAARGLAGSPYGKALGHVLRNLFERRYERARALAERELQRNDDDLWRSLAADLAVLLHDYDRALEHYAALSAELLEDPPRVDRSNASSAIWVAFILRQRGEPSRAAALARLSLDAFAPGEHEHVNVKVYRMAAHALLGETDQALGELRAAIDAGYRSILFERVVRMDTFELLADLHPLPRFQSMIGDIEADNARMRRTLRRSTVPS